MKIIYFMKYRVYTNNYTRRLMVQKWDTYFSVHLLLENIHVILQICYKKILILILPCTSMMNFYYWTQQINKKKAMKWNRKWTIFFIKADYIYTNCYSYYCLLPNMVCNNPTLQIIQHILIVCNALRRNKMIQKSLFFAGVK